MINKDEAEERIRNKFKEKMQEKVIKQEIELSIQGNIDTMIIKLIDKELNNNWIYKQALEEVNGIIKKEFRSRLLQKKQSLLKEIERKMDLFIDNEDEDEY